MSNIYNVYYRYSNYENLLLHKHSKKEILNYFNELRKTQGLCKIYSLKLLSVIEDLKIKKEGKQ